MRLVVGIALVVGLWSAYSLYGLMFDVGLVAGCQTNPRCEMDPKIQGWVVGVALIIGFGTVVAVGRRLRRGGGQ
jgi:hypothetical protein